MSHSIILQFILCYPYMYSSFISTTFSEELSALFVHCSTIPAPSYVTCLYYALANSFELKRHRGWRLLKQCFMSYYCLYVCQHDVPPRDRKNHLGVMCRNMIGESLCCLKQSSECHFVICYPLCGFFFFVSWLFVFCRYPFQTLAWLPGILNENFFFRLMPGWYLQIGHCCFFRNLYLFRFHGHAIGHYVNFLV